MIQPVGKSKTIPSFDVDYDALAQEVKTAEDKRQTREQKPTRVAKQTSGSLYPSGIDKEAVINFLENDVPQPEKKAEQPIEMKGTTKATYDFTSNPHMGGSSVMSRAGGADTQKGPSRYMQSDTSNSIWDSEKLQRLAKEILTDGGEQIRTSKESRQSVSKELEEARRNELVEALQDTDQRKASQVSPITEQEDIGAGPPKKDLSIFDFIGQTEPQEYTRVPEKTAGEELSEKRTQERQEVDDTWRGGGKASSSSEIMDSFFDKLMEG